MNRTIGCRTLILCVAGAFLAGRRPAFAQRPAAAVPSETRGAAASPAQHGGRELAPDEQALQAVNRLTFGPRPGEVDRVRAIGVDRWIDQQLRADTTLDPAAIRALDGCPVWTEPVSQAVPDASGPVAVQRRQIFRTDSMAPASTTMMIYTAIGPIAAVLGDSAPTSFYGAVAIRADQLLGGRLTRAEASDHELLEVMTDFWENHFSIYAGRIASPGAVVEWDRDVIRAHALGRFRDLLGAVAHSPTMLTYLDNAVNGPDSAHLTLPEYLVARRSGVRPTPGPRAGANENFARELLELHTLGVDGGYTQHDVIEVARAFSGWTTERRPGIDNIGAVSFVFDSAQHDAERKVVLGDTLPAGRGSEDGEEVLDLLARSPATAHFIARKLAIRFVSDSPSSALVERAAATYLRTKGDIRDVLRTIVTSPEFFSRAAFRAKVKSPTEFVLSARRALDAPIDTAAQEVELLVTLGEPPFGRVSPDGWPETGAAWMSVGSLVDRVAIATRIAHDELPSIPLAHWSRWNALRAKPFDGQVAGVIQSLLGGQVSAETRAALSAAREDPGDAAGPNAGDGSLRRLVAIALSAPEFQRR